MVGYIEALATTAALTANGTTDGVVTVASTTDFFPGAYAWLGNNAALKARVIITQILTATTMRVRTQSDPNEAPNYTIGSSISGFTVATASTIHMPRQVVKVVQPTYSKMDLQ